MLKNSFYFIVRCGLAEQIIRAIFAYKIMKKYPNKEIYFETTFFKLHKKTKHEIFLLDKFKIFNELGGKKIMLSENEFKEFKNYGQFKKIYQQDFFCDMEADKKNTFHNQELPFLFYKYFHSNSIKFIKKNLTLVNELLELTVPLNTENKNMLQLIKQSQNSVCVHVRRGDIWGGPKQQEYFLSKIKKMAHKLKTNLNLFIFSNDIKWCKENIKSNVHNITYVTINDEIHPHFELTLMKNCQHFIVSTGQFGYLAAILSQNKGKIVLKDRLYNYIK